MLSFRSHVRRMRIASAFLFLLGALPMAAAIPDAPTQWVTDTAGVLSGADVSSLNEKLRAFEQRSGVQFIVYIAPSLDGDAVEDYTIHAAEKWKVGQKKYDNGLILFVFPHERKVRIEVGYGLEGTITDAVSAEVIRNQLAPHFSSNDYAGGLNAAADALIARIESKEAPVPAGSVGGAPAQQLSGRDLFLLFIIILFFVIFVGPLLRRSGCGGCFIPMFFGGGGGTTFGGGGGGFGGFGGGGGFSGGGGGFGGGGATGSW